MLGPGHLPADDGDGFMGYVLPWGQMSYWGAQVITGFFSAFPLVGEPIRIWLLGGYAPTRPR
jgi:ubiquinol-cytochrome c reductase cytochrome b subunit